MATPASAPTSPAPARAAKGASRGAPATPVRAGTRAGVPATAAGKLQRAGYAAALLATPSLSVASSDASLLVTPPPAEPAPLPALLLDALAKKPSDAGNWRTRAGMNGIRVTPSTESAFADDEDSEPHAVSPTKPAGRLASDAPVLPQPFLSTHRRARSSTQNMNTNPTAAMAKPAQVPATPDRRKLATIANLNTPPPKSSVVDRIKLKGMMTEPAQPRRRAPFGPAAEQLFDIDENEYMPYAQSFAAVAPLKFSDPFDISLESIAEIGPGPFEHPEVDDVSFDAAIDASRAPPRACSVCDNATPRLAVLKPCSHPLCSACLTSALNIVGEKDMRCSVCNNAVDDFKLETFAGGIGAAPITSVGQSPAPTTSTPPSNRRASLLPSAFDQSLNNSFGASPMAFSLFGGMQAASSPTSARPMTNAGPGENIVLRIDNVPWDITPPAIAQWLKQPVELVHVLLDRKGKTLSHAYVELADEEIFKAALRGAQNSVLGKGKRARGVTVTRSTQEELMRALFPSWQGGFAGAMPSVVGLANEHAALAMENGLVTPAELNALQHLIRSPDSHFLKVPSLPFHSLISMLAKFPAAVNGHIPWSTTLRDLLFDLAFSSIQVMIPRVTDNQTPENLELLSRLFEEAVSCRAFTPQQSKQIADLLDHANGLPLNVSVSLRPMEHMAPAPEYMLPTPRLAAPTLPAIHGMPGMNLGLGLPSGFARGGLGNGAQLPIQQHVPSMPMHLPSMSGQQFLQLPMQAPGPLASPLFTPRQDFRSLSADYGRRAPPGLPFPAPQMAPPSRFDAIAREFNMDTNLIEALAHRLALERA